MRVRVPIGLLVAALIALAVPGAAMAVDYTVNTEQDFFPIGTCDPAPGNCTLREAIAVATAPQDRVILPAGHYNITQGELVLQTDVIVGAGARTTIIDALDNSRAVRINGETTASISGVTITHGNGDGAVSTAGGGVFIGGSALLTLSNSHVVDNTASPSGGGIAVTGRLLMVGSTLARNRAVIGSQLAAAGGGIMANTGTTVAIGNSTISDNLATGASSLGGGIASAATTLTLVNVTIAGNQAVSGGGLYQAGAAAAAIATNMNHTVIAGSTGGACAGPGLNPPKAITSHHDVIDDMTCLLTGAGEKQGVNALLGPLANNGGPTDTRALAAGSPAIDAGDPATNPATCFATDQRGTARVGVCDIGAFEFVPPPPPPPPGPPLPSPQQLPPPVAGKLVNALPKSGTVRIKLPRKRFRVLVEGEQIPLGTVVDTTKGRVTLVAAADKTGGTATADFYDGIFKIGQTKGAKPITMLKLVETLSCPKRGTASAAAKKKKKRKLWGDGKGKFRTEGSYSSATVRGTKWLVQDTCTTTLTRVVRGSVSVRDFVKKKTVIVRAGKRYTARRAS